MPGTWRAAASCRSRDRRRCGRARCTGSSAGRRFRRSCGNGGTALPASACCSTGTTDRQLSAPAFFAYAVSSIASRVELAPVPAITGTRPRRVLDRGLDQQAVLVDVDRRRFAGRADDDDAGGAVRDVKIDELARARQVERTALLHRRRDGDEASGQHGNCRQQNSAILPHSDPMRRPATGSHAGAARRSAASGAAAMSGRAAPTRREALHDGASRPPSTTTALLERDDGEAARRERREQARRARAGNPDSTAGRYASLPRANVS